MLCESSKVRLKNFHNSLFGGLLFTVLFVFMQTLQSSFSGFIQLLYEKNLNYYIFNLTTCDYQIPILTWFSLFYLSAIPSWTIIPIFIYVIYGKEKFAKLLTISLCCYLMTFLIDITFPANCSEILEYGKTVLENKTGYLNRLCYKIIFGSFPLTSFPSNHCTNQLLLAFAVIDFNFIHKTYSKDTSKKLLLKIILTLIILVYSILVCVSTFVIKVHFFIDWIPSLIMVSLFFVIFSIHKNNSISKFFYKIILNFNFTFWYSSNSSEKEYLTWGRLHHPRDLNKLSSKILIKHFAIWDITVCVFYGLILFVINNSIFVISLLSVSAIYAKLLAFVWIF